MKMTTLILGLTAAVAMLQAGSATAEEVRMNDTLKTIFNRKSVRVYSEAAVSDEQLLMLVKAGMAAPTAVDRRPWEFIVITDKAVLKKMADAMPYAKMAAQAPAAIVICGDTDRQFGGRQASYWQMDCSAATENLLLAAESMGLGAVWTSVYPEEDRMAAMRAILGIPQHVIPLNLVPVGIPRGAEKPKDKYNPGQIHKNKW
ncbi:MAG TPA: nitroreductase family protein [Candidatus Omnitrophota bacterium]|nr:nitroreductase family protein [Candidatus Omnitrophota bacterium]